MTHSQMNLFLITHCEPVFKEQLRFHHQWKPEPFLWIFLLCFLACHGEPFPFVLD